MVTADDIDIRLSTQALHSTENIQSQTGIEPLNLREAVDNFQKQLVKNALIHYQGNWTKTAKHFSRDRGNLNRLAKRLGIFVEKSIKQSK